MEKVRINNDVEFYYNVYRNGVPESFIGASEISVKLVNEAYTEEIPITYSITGNVLTCNALAENLTKCGVCRLFLSYTKADTFTTDAVPFQLVGLREDTTVEVGEPIIVSGDIGVNKDGASAYEVWESYPGNEGKTIEQYFEWLRENPTKIDLDGLNSNIDKLHFKPDTLVQLANIGDVRYSTESKTLEVKVSDTVSIQLGQEMQTRVKNDEAIQINNGQMVYINSAVGANPLAKIASTSNFDIAQRTFGMATENIPANGFGAITTEGLVRDINTSAFTEGEMLWLGTNGNVTNIEPTAPTSKISVGMVLRSNANNGIVYVKIRAIARNQKLSDVYAPTLTGGDVLRWNSTTLRFEAFNITSALSNKVDTSRTITAGNGLTGGGALSGDVTVNVGNTDDSIAVGTDGIKVDTQNSLTSTSTTKPLSAAQGKALQDNKAEKTRTITAGNGLTGGGNLTADRTIDVVSANDGITVNADNIQLNTIDNVTSTSATKPLSANQGKVLNDKVVQVETDLNGKLLTTTRTINLFNPLNVIMGQGINNDGNIENGVYANWKTSGYIPVTAGASYFLTCKTSGRGEGFQWADSNFEKISGSGNPIYNVIQTAPANASYFIFNISAYGAPDSTEVMMVQGTSAVPYVPYRLISPTQVEGLNTIINSINTRYSQQLLGIPKVFSSVALNKDFLISGIKAIYLDLSNSTKTRQEISSIGNVLKNYNGRYEVWLYYSDNKYSEISLGRQTSADEVVKVILANGIIVYIAVDWSYFSEGINNQLSGILSDWCFFKGAFAPIINTQVEGINTQVEGINTQVEGLTKSIGSRTSNNSLNPSDSNVSLGYYLNGVNLSVYPFIDTTGYMPVTPGKTYSLFVKPGTTVIDQSLEMRFVNFYNSNKELLRTIQSVYSITPSDGESFVRVSIYNGNPPSNANMRSLSDISFADNSLTSIYEEYGLVEVYLKYPASNAPDSIVDRKTLEEYSGTSEYLTIENSDKILFTGCSYDESMYSLKFKSWINKLSNYIDWQCGNHAVSGQRIIDIAQRLRADVSTYGIVPTSYKPTYITIANNGNEYLPTQGESLELYVEQVRIAKEIIESLGAKMILGTSHHVNGNPYLETDLKAMAEQLGIPYMGIGWLGEKIMSHDYQGFWGGSHPGTRTNSFVWIEWLRFINQLPTPRKVIKVFRGRNSGTDVLALNYDNNWQRATIWQEINAGERSLNTVDGSENFYDRLDEGTTIDPNDENHIITNYTGQSNNNEYVSLLSNTNVAFTDKVLLEFIINKVNVDKFTATIKGDTGISWYVKDNNNQDTWERIVRDTGLVFKVSKEVYDSFNDTIGTKFTSTKFANGTIQFAYWGRVKSWTMGKGYFLCFTADTSSTDKVSGSGTLVRVSDSTTVDFINHMTSYRYSYDYFSRIHKPKGKFVAINSTYDALTGLYTIIIENQKYFQYDRVKLIGVKSGSFNISKVEAKYDGGKEKVYKAENVLLKKQLKELITTRGFDTNWDTTGGWINENNLLVAMPTDIDSYPPYLTVKKHVVLGLDSVNGFPQKIKKTFTIEESRAYRKVIIRLVSRLFPLIYNTNKTGTYYTAYPQITKNSFDNAVITCELGGTTPAVRHAIIDTDWSEIELEFELPPYTTLFDMSIYRNIEISKVSPSENWELQLADVSLQIEDY